MDEIQVERAEGVATVTLNRPERKNAITVAMFEELGRLAVELANDHSVRAVVLTGAGGHFSSGADLTPGEGDGDGNAPGSAAARSLGVIRDQIGGAVLSFAEALDQESRAQAVCTATQDFAEGMKAFLERREPHYSGS